MAVSAEERLITEQEGISHRVSRRASNRKTSTTQPKADGQGLVELACECTKIDCDRLVKVPLYVYQRMIDAQRSLLQEQDRLAETGSGVATHLIALYKALGGGWELRQGQPVVPVEATREMEARTNWGSVLSSARPPETANNPPPGKQ